MDSVASEHDSIVGFCKHCDELFGTIRGREFPNMYNYQLFKAVSWNYSLLLLNM
jgi:hypothetical protein